MEHFRTQTLAGSITAFEDKEELSFEFAGWSSYADFGIRYSIHLEDLPDPNSIFHRLPPENHEDQLWSFATWLACRTGAREYARHVGGPGFREEMVDASCRLRSDVQEAHSRMRKLRGDVARLGIGTPEQLIASGELECIAERVAYQEWSLALAEELVAAADGIATDSPFRNISDWPEVAVKLSAGGIARIQPQFNASLHVSIDRSDKVKLDGRSVEGDAFYTRDGTDLHKDHVHARAFGKWPSDAWLTKAYALFDEAVQEYQKAYRTLDGEVINHATEVRRLIEQQLPDEFSLFATPWDHCFTNFVPYAWRGLRSPKETRPGRYFIGRIPDYRKSPKDPNPIIGLKALMKRCDDGQLALLSWEGIYSRSRRTLGSHCATPRLDVARHVAMEAKLILEKL